MQTPNVACYGTTENKLKTPPQSLLDFLSLHQGVSCPSWAFFCFISCIFCILPLSWKNASHVTLGNSLTVSKDFHSNSGVLVIELKREGGSIQAGLWGSQLQGCWGWWRELPCTYPDYIIFKVFQTSFVPQQASFHPLVSANDGTHFWLCSECPVRREILLLIPASPHLYGLFSWQGQSDTESTILWHYFP